jgi:RNA polymerase subunit RPABC4/transcription elongation factor Spt4
MTPHTEHRGIIPFAAWITAAIVSAFILLIFFMAVTNDKFGLPELVFFPFISCLVGGYILLVGYVYGDAKRRGMRHVMWTWVAILVPNGLGIILYFILREPLMVYCHHCGYRSKPGFAYCPNCGYAMAPTCPNCKRVVQPGWTHCAYCGTSLTPARTNPSAPTTGGIPGTA